MSADRNVDHAMDADELLAGSDNDAEMVDTNLVDEFDDVIDEASATAAAAARGELDVDLDDDDDEDDDEEDEEEDDEDDDDEEEDDEDIKLIKKYMELLERVNQNKYNYDDYVLLVNTAHEMSDLDKIQQSCELFASVFPLAPEIWLRWLRIELNIATTETEFEKVHQLFRRSLGDYYSTTVALEYANLAVKVPKSHETWEVLTSTYTLHCMEGRALFEAWRLHCAKSEPDGPEKYAKLVQMYTQELSLPLHNMEETYIEFKVLCEKSKDKYVVDWASLDDQYATAKGQLAKCLPYERRLLELATHEHPQRAAIYTEYIEAGKTFLNDRIVQVLHERMVTECCLNAASWLSYIHYVQRRNGVRTATNNAEQLSLVFSQTDWDICNRALRNCSWSADLYVEKLSIAERMELSRDEVKSVAEQALAAGFQSPAPVVSIWLEYLAYLRRTTDFKDERDCELLRATFALAWDSLERLFGERATDGACEILQMWGRLEYGPLSDVGKGKELWTTVMQSGENAYRSGMWMEFVHLELRKGVDGARKIYRKALAVKDMDDIAVIISAWIRFERCNGTLDQLKFAQRQCEQHQQKAHKHGGYAKSHRAGAEARTNGGSGGGTGAAKRDLKRKAPNSTAAHAASENQRHEKRHGSSKSDVQPRGSAGRVVAKSTAKSEAQHAMGPPAMKRDKLDVAPETATATDTADTDDEWHIDTTSDDVTIFLSNLAYSTTEEDITSAFPELSIENVNIIKSANGNSRGFSYVKLGSASDVEQSLTFDRRLINGRPAFISSVLRDKEQRKKFKYSADMEPTKLFVKGLSFESTKDELEEVFGAFGTVKDVRLVCQKNGKPKGLAYIEFDSEKSAGAAIMKMDQTELRGFKINVALSAPPPKPAPNTGAVSAASTLGHGRRAQTTRGDVKPRLSFIPRVVQKLALQGATTPPAAGEAPAATVPKSNADFRKFLTQSK